MLVFKFGGASVKDANAVKNLVKIVHGYKNEKLVVVVSAMGKTTNAMEKILHAYFHKEKDCLNRLNDLYIDKVTTISCKYVTVGFSLLLVCKNESFVGQSSLKRKGNLSIMIILNGTKCNVIPVTCRFPIRTKSQTRSN